MNKMVLVDELTTYHNAWKYGASCHLLPVDESKEGLRALHAMAAHIGMRPSWFQEGRYPHYDLTGKRRDYALAAGAIEITAKGYVKLRRAQRLGSFVEPGSGIRMELGHWYLLSDSGSIFSARGFATPQSARKSAVKLRGKYGLELDEIGEVGLHKDEFMHYSCNIVRSDDLLLFWALEEPHELGWEKRK